MGIRAITASKVFLDAFDVSGSLNAFALEMNSNPEDATVLDGSGARRYGPTLPAGVFGLAGLWEGGTDKINDVLAARLGMVDSLLTIVPETGTEGEAAYFAKVLEAQYDAIVGPVGTPLKFKASGGLGGACVRGYLGGVGVKNAGGNGAIVTVAGPVLGQKVYAGLHVLAVSGGTLTVKIQSATTLGFGSPTDRITFAGASVRGTQWATPVAGPITDGYWRATWSLTAGSATIAVSFGIQ